MNQKNSFQRSKDDLTYAFKSTNYIVKKNKRVVITSIDTEKYLT